MGLFGKLFDKKECAICGGEIGLLGNRKLEDGNMCKECAAKLSPWFDDRRHSTVEQIKAQLEYREQNRQELSSFRPNRVIGEEDQILIEERNGVPYRFAVAKTKDWKAENVDLFLFSDVTFCTVDVDSFDREITYRNSDGEEESYSPPRYEYNYNFFVEIKIQNNPYVDDIHAKLNDNTVEIMGEGSSFGSMFNKKFEPTYHPRYQKYQRMGEEFKELVDRSRLAPAPAAEPAPQEAPAPQAAPAGPKFCPNCGAPAEGGKFCQHCGSPF